jgi:TolA-binding protein
LGGKRIRKWKHLQVFLTGLIVLLLAGCVSMERDRFAGDLQNAAQLYARGDFEASLVVNHNVVVLSQGTPPADQSLFNMGLIFADNRYAKKDYNKSMAYFQRVVKEYPDSSLVPQAKTWIGVLQVIEKSKEVDIEIERKKKRLIR